MRLCVFILALEFPSGHGDQSPRIHLIHSGDDGVARSHLALQRSAHDVLRIAANVIVVGILATMAVDWSLRIELLETLAVARKSACFKHPTKFNSKILISFSFWWFEMFWEYRRPKWVGIGCPGSGRRHWSSSLYWSRTGCRSSCKCPADTDPNARYKFPASRTRWWHPDRDILSVSTVKI